MPAKTPKPEFGRTTWVKVEVSLDIEGRAALYIIEGRPDGGPLHVHLEPEYAGSPVAVLDAIKVDLAARLEDCTLIVTNDSDPGPRPLRLLE